VTSLQDEVAIPFAAFATARVETIEVIADEVDGSVVAVQAPGGCLHPPVGTSTAAAGRAVVAVAGSGWHTLDEPVDGLLTRLADLVGLVHDLPAYGHHNPADLGYWAAVDQSRGRVAFALDLVVCSHGSVQPGSPYIVTVEAPAHRLGVLVTAASQLPAADRRALLTSAGSVTSEAADADVVVAAAAHAGRAGGRAEAFPGQQWIGEDIPVVEVVARSAIEDVLSTVGQYAQDAVLRAYGFVRPRYELGRLVLTVGHDDPHVVTPWEVRYCRPCCG
jgi:hypothetical protein